jgi:hypothetical protein
MAAAAVPHALFSTLYGDRSYWELPNPDYAPLSERFGVGMVAKAAATATECRLALQRCASTLNSMPARIKEKSLTRL